MDVSEAAPSGVRKRDVLEELGESTLLLPSLVASGLEANDRAKYLLTLLQAARQHADAPGTPVFSLREERLAAGVVEADLDTVVGRSRRLDDDVYEIPFAGRLHGELVAAIAEMLRPIEVAHMERAPDRARLDALALAGPDATSETLRGGYLDQMTSADRSCGDSFHLLVMDAHRALNRLHAEVARDTIDGASVFGLLPGDRDLVAAFMAGVHATMALKFDHPGLTTSSTRVGGRLLIENDLGTTNAHVVVVAVENLDATVTYTDVHARRLAFFQSMLDRFPVAWSNAEQLGGGPMLGAHHVAVGRYRAPDRAALEDYLRHVGSRLVFVIDWNRARKRLTTIVGRNDSVRLLRWAAEQDLGHMALLLLGGERLIYDAVEHAAKIPARYGEPLVDVLGREATTDLVRFALRAASEGLRSGKSPLLIRDEVRVEVLRHAQASQRGLLDSAAEHAILIVEAAQAFQGALVRLGSLDDHGGLMRLASRAAGWEHDADEIVIAQRQAAERVDGGETLAGLTTTADDAIDLVEEGVYLLTLVPEDAIAAVRPILLPLASIVVTASREHLKVIEIAREVVDSADPEDLEDFIVAVDRVASLEHDADDAERAARAAMVATAPDFRSLYIVDNLVRAAEGATDVLLRAALGLRDHILSLLSAR